MKMRMVCVAALAAIASGCGPTADQFEQSIVENYEGEGYEDVSVALEASEDGGFVGNVSYTDPETGRTEERECTVEPVEGTEVPWRCLPSVATIEQQITETYAQNGATDIRPSLSRDGEDRYAGHVEFRIPGLDEQLRHDCEVDLAGDAEATWNCGPAGGEAAKAAAAPDADAGAATGENVKG